MSKHRPITERILALDVLYTLAGILISIPMGIAVMILIIVDRLSK